MIPVWRTRRPGMERRRHPRIPLAVPVRYATDQGHAGIGVLIDVHEEGAGLLVPNITADAFHVWIQFLWFDDRMGVQGRIVFVRETPDGFHVGVQLQPQQAQSRFLSTLLIPYALRKFTYDRKHPFAFLNALTRERREAGGHRRRRYLPVLVEQGAFKAWAITEERDEQGAVLLLPSLPEAGAPLRITTWGSFISRCGNLARTETLNLPPVRLMRLVVVFEQEPVSAEQRVPDPAVIAS